MNFRSAVVVLTASLAWACASSQTQAGSSRPRHDPNLITAEELATANASNLYDAVRQLRPQWTERGTPTAIRPEFQTEIVVYMDRIRFGDVDALRTIPLRMVASVRWLSSSQAQGEFGVGNIQGVIQVVTRRVQ